MIVEKPGIKWENLLPLSSELAFLHGVGFETSDPYTLAIDHCGANCTWQSSIQLPTEKWKQKNWEHWFQNCRL